MKIYLILSFYLIVWCCLLIDHFDSIKIQIGCVLNDYGKDYKNGGFSVFKKDNTKLCLEPSLVHGSLFIFFPGLFHTVDPIDPTEKIDFNSEGGR